MLNLIEKPLPLISCLLVTAKGRLDYFKRSVQCFCDQTYPNKELLIVNEGNQEYQNSISEHVKSLERSDIRTEFLNGYYSLGALRNISLGLANGEIFCQWDDDDFNFPSRLATQYRFMGEQICYLSDQLHYYFSTNELYWEDWKFFLSGGHLKYSLIPGTIMGRIKDLPARYPSGGKSCKAGEDTVFANQLLRTGANVKILSGYGNLHVYSFHGRNVFDIEHHRSLSRIRSYYKWDLAGKRELISETLRYLNFENDVKVMGRDGLAFIHENNFTKS